MSAFIAALSILQQLHQAGYIAYFAGGWVRDFLLGIPGGDIDIATSAPPSVIQKLFPRTLPIGAAFGIILVMLEGQKFEVATFRRDFLYKDGRHPSRVEFTSAEEDALRRDFTINGMFYDPLTDNLMDFVGGKRDLEQKIIRAIGIPSERFHEDRLRMLRAVRFSSLLDFTIDPETQKAIQEQATTLFPSVAVERVWQEISKMANHPSFFQALITLNRLNLLTTIFPSLQALSEETLLQRLIPLRYFPPESPPMAKILLLFPQKSLEEQIELCEFFKLSNQEKAFIEFLFHAQNLFLKTQDIDLYTWAHFYSHPQSKLTVEILAAKEKDEASQKILLEEQQRRKKHLEKEIRRIVNHQPVLTSSILQEAGIPPGKLMGLLLKEGEKLAINHHIEDPQALLALLKKSSLWKTS